MIINITIKGIVVNISYEDGDNLLICMRQNNISIKANCGGFCSCKTCHIYIQENYFNSIPELYTISDEELDVLEKISDVRFNSRLACQLTLTASMENMNIEVSPNSCS